MQAHETEKMPKFNPAQPDGVKPQASDELITAVLVSGEWIPIVPGSFKYYVSQPNPNDKAKMIPYIQFDVEPNPAFGALAGTRIEVFPQSVGGYAYKVGV
ncbi:hypothetical protein SEA_LABELLE_88 [Mycobacterium phage Labelle]|nr:hypothetical protein SEA_LABELLE_88 [Mycobacterium phage Labelle]